ncbi:hypothetical protein [Nesterenkonia pannonica]|uniref:hypothetical protein n=1 Tax=Nesterenkonia pannonica TaxID=1548602 RepID=UPI00216437AC|nr:hypothetical protein [Nesterenkonia pannonica]
MTVRASAEMVADTRWPNPANKSEREAFMKGRTVTRTEYVQAARNCALSTREVRAVLEQLGIQVTP